MSERLQCEFCGRGFEPDRYNCHHQRCCGRTRCLRAMNAERQARHRSQRREDPEWRASEVSRVQASRRRKREREAQEARARSPHELAFLGVVSQTLGNPSPAEVGEYLCHCRERGREVALQLNSMGSSVRGP